MKMSEIRRPALLKWTPQSPETMVFDGNESGGIAEMRNVSSSYAGIIAEMERDAFVDQATKLQLIRTVMNGRWFSEALDCHYKNPTLWK